MFNVRSLAVSFTLALGLVAGCATEEDASFADDQSDLQAADENFAADEDFADPEAPELFRVGNDPVTITPAAQPRTLVAQVAAAQSINAFVEFANDTVFGSATIHNPDSNVLRICVKVVRDGRLDQGAFHCNGGRLGSGSTTMAAPQLHCRADSRNHRYKTRVELHLKNNGIGFGESRGITLKRICN